MVSYESMYQSYRTLASGWVSLMQKRGRVPQEELNFLILNVSVFTVFSLFQFNHPYMYLSSSAPYYPIFKRVAMLWSIWQEKLKMLKMLKSKEKSLSHCKTEVLTFFTTLNALPSQPNSGLVKIWMIYGLNK